jgi:hypothetical protein
MALRQKNKKTNNIFLILDKKFWRNGHFPTFGIPKNQKNLP